MTDHPPKPRLTLRVGITGHRPNKLPKADLPRIERQLRDAFAAIEAAVAKAYDANKAVYASVPAADQPATTKPYRIRLISGFAEGADQIAVAVCPADWIVEAILPFPKDEYLKDFEKSAADDDRDVRDELAREPRARERRDRIADAAGAQPGLRSMRQLPAPADRRADRRVGRRAAEARRHRRGRAGGP